MVRRHRYLIPLVLVASILASTASANAAGNPDGDAFVPPAARAVDTSKPDRWVGNGTRASCTWKRVVKAVAKGGIIRFRCGRKPIVIKMKRTAKVRNDRPNVVLDCRGKVTLDGKGERRILQWSFRRVLIERRGPRAWRLERRPGHLRPGPQERHDRARQRPVRRRPGGR